MKFYFEPNHTVIQVIAHKLTKASSRYVVCKFDENGVCETNDPKVMFILQNKLTGCTWDTAEPTVSAIEVKEILSDDEIRELAKAKGIKSWHMKSINRLKEELEV